jgi:hypothetical protein
MEGQVSGMDGKVLQIEDFPGPIKLPTRSVFEPQVGSKFQLSMKVLLLF